MADDEQIYQPPPAGPQPVVPHQPTPPAARYDVPSYPPQPVPLYGQPDYLAPFPPQRPEHPSSGAVLGLGIGGLFFPPLSVVAWILGSRAKGEIKRGAPYRWGAMGQTGYILGIAYSVLIGMMFMLMILFLMLV